MTKVKAEKLVVICNRLGLQVIEQPSQYRIQAAGDASRRFYIPGTELVHKVELSGWTHELAVEWGSVYPGRASPSPKRITHILDFSKDERLILNDFYRMARTLAGASSEPEPEVEEAPAEEPAAQVA